MAIPLCAPRASRIFAGLLCFAAAALSPGIAEAAQARLVRCGAETCLRLSGHRFDSAHLVRVAGRLLAVEGGRAWHATVPLATARDWPGAAGGTLRLMLVDPATGSETADLAVVPPGALGRRVELASLLVSAH